MKTFHPRVGTTSILCGLALFAHSSPGACQVKPSLALNPEVASSLVKFGLAVSVGSAELIANSSKGNVESGDATELGKDLNNLVHQYRRTAAAANFSASLVETNGEVIITTTQVLATASGVGAIPAAAVASVARYGNSKFAAYIADEGMGRARGVLSSGLQTMSNAERKKFDKLIEEHDYKEAANLFEKRTKKLSKMEEMLKNDPAAATATRQVIMEAMRDTTSTALITAGKAYAKSTQIEKDLADHIKASNEFSSKIAGKVKALETSSLQLKNEIEAVQIDLQALKAGNQATAYQLSIVQDIMFDQQGPAAKLALLDSGAKPGLNGVQRETVVKYLQVEIKKQKILDTASTVVRAAADVNTILKQFGINDRTLNDAVNYGAVATAALSQAFTGNYLGAMATVSGLFGGGQEDPNQKSFAKVFAQLEEIQKQLDTVIQLQKQTLQAIEDLSKQLASVETRLHERLDNIDFELKTINAATTVKLWGDYSSCMTSWDHRGDSKVYKFDDSALRFESVRGMSAYTKDWGAISAFNCADSLRGMFSQLRTIGEFGNPLRLEFAISTLLPAPPVLDSKTFVPSELQAYLDDVHAPSAVLVVDSWRNRRQTFPGWGSDAGVFASLASPAATADELLARTRKLDAREAGTALTACSETSLLSLRAKTLLCSDGAVFDPSKDAFQEDRARDRTLKFLKDAIVRDQVGDLMRWAGLVSGPSNFASGGASNNSPLSLQELAVNTSGSRISYGRDILFSALTISDISIAQQALVYGDLTAYFVFKELWDQSRKFVVPTTERQKNAAQILRNANNPWLRHNVAMLILMSATKRCGEVTCVSTELGYRTALAPLLEMSNPIDGSASTLVPIDDARRERTRQLLLGQFQLPDDIEVVASDTLNGASTARRISIKLAGFDLPLPELGDWTFKNLIYPPGMFARIKDREVLAERWAEYAALDDIDVVSQVRLVRAVSGGDGR